MPTDPDHDQEGQRADDERDTMSPEPLEDDQIMPDVAERILSELAGLRSQLDRLEGRLERVEALGSKVAVLERQDNVDRETAARLEGRISQVELAQRALYRLETVERDTEANGKAIAALAKSVGCLETARARGEGMSKALIASWTVLTATPGLIGLALTLWKLWPSP